MEVIMATETTKVKKMDDNGTVKGKKYVTKPYGELGDGERRVKEQVKKQGLKQSLQKMK